MNTTELVVETRPEKNSGPYGMVRKKKKKKKKCARCYLLTMWIKVFANILEHKIDLTTTM